MTGRLNTQISRTVRLLIQTQQRLHQIFMPCYMIALMFAFDDALAAKSVKHLSYINLRLKLALYISTYEE